MGIVLSALRFCRNSVFEELIRDKVASKVVAELSVIKSVEHLAIILDTAIFALKDLAKDVGPDDVRCLLEVITCEAGAFPYALAILRHHEERVVLDPRFNSLRQYFTVIKEFSEGLELPQELSGQPWRAGTYSHLRPEKEEKREVFAPKVEEVKKPPLATRIAIVAAVAGALATLIYILWFLR